LLQGTALSFVSIRERPLMEEVERHLGRGCSEDEKVFRLVKQKTTLCVFIIQWRSCDNLMCLKTLGLYLALLSLWSWIPSAEWDFFCMQGMVIDLIYFMVKEGIHSWHSRKCKSIYWICLVLIPVMCLLMCLLLLLLRTVNCKLWLPESKKYIFLRFFNSLYVHFSYSIELNEVKKNRCSLEVIKLWKFILLL
jgi:hypothetical protein